jgi:hypothetical protein
MPNAHLGETETRDCHVSFVSFALCLFRVASFFVFEPSLRFY